MEVLQSVHVTQHMNKIGVKSLMMAENLVTLGHEPPFRGSLRDC